MTQDYAVKFGKLYLSGYVCSGDLARGDDFKTARAPEVSELREDRVRPMLAVEAKTLAEKWGGRVVVIRKKQRPAAPGQREDP